MVKLDFRKFMHVISRKLFGVHTFHSVHTHRHKAFPWISLTPTWTLEQSWAIVMCSSHDLNNDAAKDIQATLSDDTVLPTLKLFGYKATWTDTLLDISDAGFNFGGIVNFADPRRSPEIIALHLSQLTRAGCHNLG